MGGSQKTSVEVPQWLQGAAQNNIQRANEIAMTGYVPYYGPDVAAFNPMQEAAFQNTADAASAFGLAAPRNAMGGMPEAQRFAGGVQGYSSAPMYQQSLDMLRQNDPGIYNQIRSMFINPQTGAGPSGVFNDTGMQRTQQSGPVQQPAPTYGGGSGGSSGNGGGVRSTTSGNTVGSYLPGGVNMMNPSSKFNQAAAMVTSRPSTVSASNRPMANPRRK